MSCCDNDIDVLKYIGDTNEINMNTAEEFSGKGVDVFNATDDFFNDKCKYYNWYYDKCTKWNCVVDSREVHNCYEPRETSMRWRNRRVNLMMSR